MRDWATQNWRSTASEFSALTLGYLGSVVDDSWDWVGKDWMLSHLFLALIYCYGEGVLRLIGCMVVADSI
jgi:hypothetical protein